MLLTGVGQDKYLVPSKDLNVAEECETMTSNAGICCGDPVGISVGLHEVPLA